MFLIDQYLSDYRRLRVELLTPTLLRVRCAMHGAFGQTGLERYEFLHVPEADAPQPVRRRDDDGNEVFAWEGYELAYRPGEAGFTVKSLAKATAVWTQDDTVFDGDAPVARFSANEQENWVGFGDQTRERLYHRGHVADLNVRNVKSYVPVPFFMSQSVRTLRRRWRFPRAHQRGIRHHRDYCPEDRGGGRGHDR